jgi:histidine kinase/DNA gyrase B/HSP90-like ATPase
MDGMNEELVWFADREFHTTVAGPSDNPPLYVLETDESSLAHARAHVRALQGKSTAFEVACDRRAFSCHVRPLYGEHQLIVGSFGVAIETTQGRDEPAATRGQGAVRVQRAGTRSVAAPEGTPGRIARRMRAFSRPGRPTPFDVVEHLRTLLPRIEARVPESVSVVFEPPEGPAVVAFDATRLTQVVVGVVANARDAMPQGGTLRIEVKPGPKTVEIVVSDDGVGIPHENMAWALEPYFTTKRGHAGLGLATARVLLAAGGGAITLESTFGAGTAVAIALPAADAAST